MMKTEKMSRKKLSGRLQAAAELVTVRTVVADVGTDHGYLPVWLCGEGVTEKAIAMDLREGPLQRAGEHIREAGLTDRIEVRISDGLSALKPGEADGAVITGMGGILISRILRQSPDIVCKLSELVLGPQSDAALVRRTLESMHFLIDREIMLKEDGKYYVLIHAVPDSGPETAAPDDSHGYGLSDTEAAYGPCLLREKNPVLLEYLLREITVRETILRNLQQISGDTADRRRHEIEEEKQLAEAALNRYEL